MAEGEWEKVQVAVSRADFSWAPIPSASASALKWLFWRMFGGSANPLSVDHYAAPPFAFTRGFRAALREASVSFGIERLENLQSVDPPPDFLRIIRKKLS
jgi:hypothetical protein